MSVYNKKVMGHFLNPHNMGEMKNPDGVGQIGNPICGDILKIYIKVKDGKIVDCKFETMGCAAAIATSSIVTEMAKGRTLEEAERISNQDIVEELGSLPPIKTHCSNLAADGLRKAIDDYKKKKL